MKQLAVIFFAFCVVVFGDISAFADQYVHGYTRSNGTYVQPYYRSSPNNTVRDNFSYKGNVNPYTGAVGRNRYIHDKTSPYYQGPDSHGRIGHNGASCRRPTCRLRASGKFASPPVRVPSPSSPNRAPTSSPRVGPGSHCSPRRRSVSPSLRPRLRSASAGPEPPAKNLQTSGTAGRWRSQE